MNQLMTSDIKMTSLDIAEIVEKKHQHVMRDIRNEIESLGSEIGQSIFGQSTYKNTQNKEQPCYEFGKDGAMQLALKYDAKTRFKVIKRIEELENNKIDTTALSPELQLFNGLFQSLANQELATKQLETKIDGIRDVVALNTIDWRKDSRDLINKIAISRGGYGAFKEVHSEVYKEVERRGGYQLNIRLTNKRRRLADEGASKSKRDKLSKVDVIADDKRLVEIYVSVVKEFAIKHGVDAS